MKNLNLKLKLNVAFQNLGQSFISLTWLLPYSMQAIGGQDDMLYSLNIVMSYKPVLLNVQFTKGKEKKPLKKKEKSRV